MTFIARRVLIALLMFSALVLPAAAQEPEGVTVTGSAVAGLAFQEVATVDSFVYDFSGTQNGINAFCGGAADIVLANRPLSVGEVSACTANGVEFVEVLIGFDGYALVASPDVDFATCTTAAELDGLVAPSLAGAETTWSSVNSSYPELAFEFVYSGTLSRPAALLDRSVRGEGFRSDSVVLADSAAVIADVAAGSGKLGLISLADAATAEGVVVLDLTNSTLSTCVEPTAENALNRLYQGGDRLFAYATAGALGTDGVSQTLALLVAPESAEALTAAGFVPLTEGLSETAASVISSATLGRSFSNEVNTFTPAGDPTGTLRVGAAAGGVNYLKSALAVITPRFSTITLEESYLGAPAAIREFCNGNREIIALTGEFSAEEQANCDANNVAAYDVPLGAHAAVLIAAEGSDYLACVSTATIADVFATSAEPAATWNAFNSEFPEDPIYLFVAGKSDALVDLMMIEATGLSTPVREDAQVSADAAYRAAAVANTSGALAVMSWAEAQDALADQPGLQLVSVQAEGGECVAPSVETIGDGTYPLAQAVRLVVNQRALETAMVQSVIYALFGDDNYAQLEAAGLAGISFGDLVGIRAGLVEDFNAADAAEAARFAEETAPEATDEATAPDAEPTGDVTPVAEEPTAEATVEEATAEATAEPTEEAAEPTVEATVEDEPTTDVEPTVEATAAP